MFKKIFSIVSLSVLASSCGKNAQAQELIYAPSDLQSSQCGDPTKGTYNCDSDSITYTYYNMNPNINQIYANGWVNNGVVNSETPTVFGPYLTIPGLPSGSTLNVSATARVLRTFAIGKSFNDCSNYGNQHEHLFDIVISGDCYGQQDRVLQRASISVAGAGYSPVTGGCMVSTNFASQANLGLSVSTDSNTCSNFQFEMRQVSPTLYQINDPDLAQLKGFTGFHPINMSVLKTN